MDKRYYVYILAARKNGPIYIGLTSDLSARVFQHKSHEIKGHTAKYGIDRLVYFEAFEDVYNAIKREKRLKRWRRVWKDELIERDNPSWDDLYGKLNQLI